MRASLIFYFVHINKANLPPGTLMIGASDTLTANLSETKRAQQVKLLSQQTLTPTPSLNQNSHFTCA